MPDTTNPPSTEHLFHAKDGKIIRAYVRDDTQDWNTLFSCIGQDEYELVGTLNPGDTFVDLGAHVGGASLLALSQGAYVIAVEALPENVEQLERNVMLNGWQNNIRILHRAIAAEDVGHTHIYYGDTATDSGKVHEFIGHMDGGGDLPTTVRSATVMNVSLNKVIDDCYVDLLKMDCEGGEWAALEGATPDTLRRIAKIVAELHPTPGQTISATARLQALLPTWEISMLGADTGSDVLACVTATPNCG